MRRKQLIQKTKLKIQKFLSRHPDSSLQAAWNFAQLMLLVFPLIPSVGAIGLLLASLVTWKQEYRRIIRRPLNWGFAIFSLWLLVTACFAVYPSDAFLGLANFLPFFLVFAGISALLQTPAQLRQISWCLVAPSLLVVILGVGQMFLGWTGPAGLSSLLGWALEPKGNPPGRMASVFMYANILAAYLIIVFILGLGLLIDTYQQLQCMKAPQAGEIRKSSLRMHLAFLSVAVVGSCIALVLTDSRNAWTIAIASCLVFALYQGWWWLVAASLGVAGSVLGAAYGPSSVQRSFRQIVPTFFWMRLTDQMYPNRPVADLRITQWQFAWSMTQQRPWTGWGLRNFTPLYQAKMNTWLGHPHNLFLMLTAETGIPATICLCSLIGWILAQGVLLLTKCPSEWQQDRLIIFSYLVAFGGCTLFNTVDVTLFDLRVNLLGWLLLAAICGVVYKRRAIASN